MKKLLLLELLLAAGFLLLPVSTLAFEATVSRVRDGDSLSVLSAGRRLEVRLYGIDAPELAQRWGKASRRALGKLAGPGVVVKIRTMSTDPHGRIVGIVSRRDQKRTLNQLMVEKGQAWVYERFCRARFCREWKLAQQTAQKNRLGLWSEDNPTSPWQFRHVPEKKGITD